MNPRNRGFHLVDLPEKPAHQYHSISKNICWSPDAFQGKDIDAPLVYRPKRLVSSPENDTVIARTSSQTRTGTARESTSTSSSVFDLEVHSDSTLYSHAPPGPNSNQSMQPQKAPPSRNENKPGKKALGFLRNSGGSQHQESSSSRNSNDDFLYRNPQSPPITGGPFPVTPAAPSFQSIFSTNGPSNSNRSNSSDRYDSNSFETMDGGVLMEDWLQKRSSSLQLVWRRRWCVLKDGCLFYYRSNMETKPIGILNLADYSLLTSGPDLSRRSKLAFRLSLTASLPETIPESVPTRTISSSTPAPPSRSSGGAITTGGQETNQQQHHLFHAETQETLDLWVELIQTSIDLIRERKRDATKKIGGSVRACSLEQAKCLTYGYRSQLNPDQHGSGAQTAQREDQSIIDKVLDRLLLEDPTLSDMNDPSTLIMPSHEQPSGSASVRSLQMCEDDNLDAWSATSSSFLYSRHKDRSNDDGRGFPAPHGGGHSLTTDTSTSSSISIIDVIDSNRQAISRHGQHSTEEQPMYTEASFSSSLYSHSAASSYAGASDIRKKQRPSSVISSGQDHHGKTSIQQSHGESTVVHGDGKSCPTTLQTSGTSVIAQRGLPPISTSKRRPFSSSNSFTTTSLASPEYYILEVDHPYQDRSESLISTSTNGTSSSGSSLITPTTVESGMALIEQERTLNRGSFVNFGGGQDLSTAVIMEKEAKAAVSSASSPKKIKKLWSVYGTSSNASFDSSVLKSEPIAITSMSETDFSEQSIDYNGSNNNNNKRSTTTTSQALDSSNPLLRGLVLVAPTSFSKKSGGSKSSNSVKGNSFSKSMTSLSSKEGNVSSWNPFPDSGAHQVPVSPRALSTRSSSSSSVNMTPKSRELSSASAKDEKHRQQNRQHSLDYTRSRSSTINALSSRGTAHTAPISLIPSEWTAKEGSERRPLYQSTQIRCVDPDLLVSALSLSFHPQEPNPSHNRNKNPFAADISRHIVPTDELVMAIAQETAAEELLKREQELNKDRLEESSKRWEGHERKQEYDGDSIVVSATVATLNHEQSSFAPAIPTRSPHRAPVLITHK